MGRDDAVAAERRQVDPVVEELAVDDAGAPGRRPEGQRDAAMGERPAVAGQGRRRGGAAIGGAIPVRPVERRDGPAA